MPRSTMTMTITTVELAQPVDQLRDYAHPMIKRRDKLTAIYVNLAINMLDRFGAAPAARFLFEQGVNFEVAHRVLLRPAMRR